MNAYHQSLRAGAETALQELFAIKAVGTAGDWTKVGNGSKFPARIKFSVVSGVTTSVAGRREPDYVVKVRTLPDVETTLSWWLSWVEEWETVTDSPSEVTLRSSSLGFYCASRHAVAPEELVFRAEWGPFDLGLIQSGNAAHPHWHAHRDVVCESAQGGKLSVVELHGFHLPMGGWTHSSIEPATCWQYAPPTSEASILRDWAIRTIKYFQAQLGEEEIAQAGEG